MSSSSATSTTTDASTPAVLATPKPITAVGMAHLAVVYVVWGSTYLAIRYGVSDRPGQVPFEPFTLGFLRLMVAGPVLLAWAALVLRQNIRLPLRELWRLFVTGNILWAGANGLVTWSEQRTHSGYAALVVGALPIWVALIDSVINRKSPSKLLVGSLLLGFAGLSVLVVPQLKGASTIDVLSIVALILAPIHWAIGSIWQARHPVSAPPVVAAAWQQFFGAAGFGIIALLTGEKWTMPTTEPWLALGYLIVFGSLMAFTSFVILVRTLPINIAMTYAYVNPVVAVILGWLMLKEEVSVVIIVGMVMTLAGVSGVFHEKYGKGSK